MTTFIIIAALIAFAVMAAIGAPLLRRQDASGAVRLRFGALMALGLAPVSAALIYLQVGAPRALDPLARNASAGDSQAEAIAAMSAEDRAAMVDDMVEGLAARLAVNPEDLQGWRMLARSYGVLARQEDAANAWREALVLSEGAAEDWRGLAIALMEQRAPDNANGPAIKEAFEEVLLQSPQDPMALYFLGAAAKEQDDTARARELWTRLRRQVPDDAPLAAELDAQLSALE